jgi:beta-glucanase (GH16 family)
MTIRNIFLLIPLMLAHAAFAQPPNPTYKLVWSDEFNYNGLPDSSKWSYDTGGSGWGNNELEFYTHADTANASVYGGNLHITARGSSGGRNPYTSARLVTKFKGDWLYGRVEVRAMLPAGKGLWPAIWMLPTDSKYGGWPACGEIDIMENVGFMPDSVFGSVHTKRFNHTIGTGFTVGHYMDNQYKTFHVYAVDWDAGHIRFSIDGNTYAIFRNTGQGFEEWPFDQAFHCILNLAVGGNWGGKYGVDDKNFPATLLVDYVRVYQTSP